MQSNTLSIPEIKQDQSLGQPNYEEKIKELNGDATQGGWKLEQEGKIGKHEGSSIKLYTKKVEGESLNYVRFDACMPNVDVNKYMVMMNHIEVRKKWDEKAQKNKVIDVIGNTEIIHAILDMPFPLSNREQVARRFVFCNKYHGDFFKKHNLPTDVPAYFVVIQPVDIKEMPIKSSPVRAKFAMVVLCQQDPSNPKNTLAKVSMKADMGGSIPDFAVNMISVKMPVKLNEGVLDNYAKLDKEGQLDKKLAVFEGL